jgi:signal transduction histidine kinase
MFMKKTAWIHFGGVIIVLMLIAFAFERIIDRRFRTIEKNSLITRVNIAKALLREEVDEVDRMCAHYAFWNPTSEFVLGRNEGFLTSDLAEEVMKNLRLDFMLLLDNTGGELAFKTEDARSEAVRRADERRFISQIMPQLSTLMTHEDTLKGIAPYGDRMLLLAARPIISSSKPDSIKLGTLIFGTFLKKEYVRGKLMPLLGSRADILQTRTSDPEDRFYRFDHDGGFNDYSESIHFINDALIGGRGAVRDIFGHSSLLFEVVMPRDITLLGRESAILLFGFFVFSLGAMVFGSFFLLKRLVLERIVKLASELEHCAANNAINACVTEDDSGDEVAHLAGNINRLLEAKHQIHGKLDAERLHRLEMARELVVAQMASSIAHEINNPIAIILSSTQLLSVKLMTRQVTETELRSTINNIDRACKRISSVIHRINQLGFCEDREAPTAEPLPDIIADAANVMRGLLEADGISFDVRKDHREIYVNCRRREIIQVLTSIIGNAREAVIGQENPWITVTVTTHGEDVFVAVTNSGSKISEDEARKIMDPFYPSKEPDGGMGLGLSVARRIVESHQGRLIIEMQNPYTCFVFSLKKAEAEQKAEEEILIAA